MYACMLVFCFYFIPAVFLSGIHAHSVLISTVVCWVPRSNLNSYYIEILKRLDCLAFHCSMTFMSTQICEILTMHSAYIFYQLNLLVWLVESVINLVCILRLLSCYKKLAADQLMQVRPHWLSSGGNSMVDAILGVVSVNILYRAWWGKGSISKFLFIASVQEGKSFQDGAEEVMWV